MDQKLSGKVAVITGAGGTLCSEMARDLAGKGAKVVLIGRQIDRLQKVAKQIKENGGAAISLSADVTKIAEITSANAQVLKDFGQCDILVNGAGGNQPAAVTSLRRFQDKEITQDDAGGFFNISMDKFKDVIEANTMGTVIPCHVFGKEMAERGGGCIVNIASMNSFRPLSSVGAYGMAKAGIMNFTQWLAAYLAPAHIRVNAIAPGFFLNERSRKMLLTSDGFSERGQHIIDHTPMKRFGEAPELLGCLNWLIDDTQAGFVTGITVPVDGGFLTDSGV